MKTHMKKRKVLLVDVGASMGGVEAYLEALAKMLAPETDLFALCVLSDLAERLRKSGVRVTKIRPFSRFRILRFVTALLKMVYLLIRYDIDVVQINGFMESILLGPARLLGRETVYTRHGPFEMDLYSWYRHPLKFLPRMLSRYCAHQASRIVCVSESVGTICKPLFPVGKVSVIPNWVTTLPGPRSRANKRMFAQIVCIGRLERYKGVHLLIESVRSMTNVEVTIVGEGTYRHELERLAYGLNVKFVGFQSDPTPYYRQSDVFVMPSLGPEGLPMVAIEAMSHMLPCVFSDLPVHREISDSGDAATLFRRGDVEDLRSKLQLLLESESERDRLAENAYQLVKRKYHEPVSRQAYLKIFAAA